MLKSFLHNSKAATAIEYALIASLISTAIILGLTGVSDGVIDDFDYVSNNVNTAVNGSSSGS